MSIMLTAIHMIPTASFEKLLKLKGLMLTLPGRAEAENRQQIMVDFLRHYFREKNVSEWSEFLEEYLHKYDF